MHILITPSLSTKPPTLCDVAIQPCCFDKFLEFRTNFPSDLFNSFDTYYPNLLLPICFNDKLHLNHFNMKRGFC